MKKIHIHIKQISDLQVKPLGSVIEVRFFIKLQAREKLIPGIIIIIIIMGITNLYVVSLQMKQEVVSG